MYLKYYLQLLGYERLPLFLVKYLQTPSLLRLKKINYFCGMNYASKEIYSFQEEISRYDHSLTTALLVYRFTHDKSQTLAGLYHDVGTPCFSHVIDYMNGDYAHQESTEAYTEEILKKDRILLNYLKEDSISLQDMINFKQYSIVDNDRPKLCADRLDGIILTGMSWTQNITLNDIKMIVSDLKLFQNEFQEQEIGFQSMSVARKVMKINEAIDIATHSKEDNYMMQLLANLTFYAIKRGYISYQDLYSYHEDELYSFLKQKSDSKLQSYFSLFEHIKKEDVPSISMPYIKKRSINPLVNGVRMNK